MTSINYQQNPDLEQNADLLEKPNLPPRNSNAQLSPAPYVLNQNIFRVLLKNIRQITSLTAG